MRRHRVLRTTALALVGIVGLAACGDTSSDDATDTTVAEGDTPAGEAVDCEATPGTTVTVEIPEFSFSPNPVEISACDSVVWENTHSQAHTSTGKGDKAWNTGNLASGGASDAVLFDQTGTFAYICALHPFMEGTVEVS